MKRTSRVLGVMLFLTFGLPVTGHLHAQEQQPIKIFIDGANIAFTHQPLLLEGTTMVPFRLIFEKLGYAVQWNKAERTVLAKRYGTDIALRLDSVIGAVNEVQYWLSQPPLLTKGTTYVPLRYIAEASGAEVRWNSEQRSVHINHTDKLTKEEQIRHFLNKYFYSLSLNEYIGEAIQANSVKLGRTEIMNIDVSPEGNTAEAIFQVELTAAKGSQFSTFLIELQERLTIDEGLVWSIDPSARTLRVIHETPMSVNSEDLYMDELLMRNPPPALSELSSIEDVAAFIIRHWEYGTDRAAVEQILKDLKVPIHHHSNGMNYRIDFRAKEGYVYNSENGMRPDIESLRKGTLQGQLWLEWNSRQKLERLDLYWTRTGDNRKPKYVFTYGTSFGGSWY
ncbi:stalk domain-containing protein [Paenibacillus montanisoli]|uniref:Copper amine oxidase-like N-terminal domain-containing protein n=1 Tax=Paenibacillus montanisoli TaxID=2081970 RepID=A0A328U455_9BACL|nr:stalk domain-containing protein [Paenibacillus montanisoli]RAP75685.1 hypothetical protein DL346_09510 [Paenibacillus montanisoli]